MLVIAVTSYRFVEIEKKETERGGKSRRIFQRDTFTFLSGATHGRIADRLFSKE